MAPIKATLETASHNLAKSFSADTRVRFNTVNAGPLKTRIRWNPWLPESYLYAEKLTFRKQNLTTKEAADTAAFPVFPASSGIRRAGTCRQCRNGSQLLR